MDRDKTLAKTALITGATSGIGEAAAVKFIQAGWRVIATGRRAERLEKLAADIGFDAAIAALPAAFRDIDLLVNNAGLALGRAPAQAADLDQWRTMIDTNITALVTITRKLLPVLIKQRGAIINISSVAANHPYLGGNVYGGTKAFVRQFSLGLRSDLQGTGVRVTSIEPGMTETEFTLVRTGGDQTVSDQLYKGADPMTGEDIADTMVWIAQMPAHLNINTLEIMPVTQSFAGFQIYREPA